MFSNFTEEARQVIVRAKKEMFLLKHPYVGSEHLLLAILSGDNGVSRKLKEFNLTYDRLKDEIVKIIGVGSIDSNYFLYTPLLKRVMENAITDSREDNSDVTIEHLFISLLEEGEGVAIRILVGMNIDIDKLYEDFSRGFVKKSSSKLTIDELGVDLCSISHDPVIGRDDEIKRVIEILCRRTKNNPILVGEAGVGKTAIVEELSRMIFVGDVPISLKNKRIISLDMATLVAGTKYRGEFEDKVRKILKEVQDSDDIILFIDEIHTLVGAGGAEGAIDASNIFKPALARGKIRVIGATTIDEYKKFIRNDQALDRRFQMVNVSIPSKDKTRDILNNLKPIYESFHGVKVSSDIVNLITDLSEKYIYGRFEPDKSIDILDEVCSYVSLKETKEMKKYSKLNRELQCVINGKKDSILKRDFKSASSYKVKENKIMDELNNLELSFYNKHVKKVTREDVAHVVFSKTNIPVYELLNDQGKIIDSIYSNLKDNIVGQDSVIDRLIDITKRIKFGFNGCTSLMFCGPTGVGKTKLASIFGDCLTGNVIRLDMSEFSEAHSVSKIVGSAPGYVGYNDNKCVLEEIKNKPYSVLILDEIERAHSDVISLFLQVLDNGRMKDSRGEVVRFDNVIIIMTSNIGFGDINIGFNKSDNSVINRLKECFGIPFINRIDDVLVFNSLSYDDLYYLVNNKLVDVKNKFLNDIDFCFDDKIISSIVSCSDYKVFGARKVDKIIKEKVLNQIIDKVILKENSVFIEELV